MAPVRSYTNWNSRTTDEEEQIEPYRKYFFICEGANTETWYFKKLIDIRKELNIHQCKGQITCNIGRIIDDIRNDDEITMKQIMVEGLLSIQAGENPRVIEEKLKSFLSPGERENQGDDAQAGEAAAEGGEA